jgi:hypothetical protein
MPSRYSCPGREFLPSKVGNFLIVQTIRRYFGSRLKNYGMHSLSPKILLHSSIDLSRVILYLALVHVWLLRHLLLHCIPKHLQINEWRDSYMFLVNLQPLHPNAKYQPLFYISSKTGNWSDF